MTWPVVARRNLRELRADNTLLYLCGIFALLGGGIAYGSSRWAGAPPLATTLSILFLFGVPLTAGTLVHESIPRSVSSGRIRLTLSLPHTRAAFVAGVGAAGLAATLAVTGVGVLTAAVVYAVQGAPVDALTVVPVFVLSCLLAAAFVGATLAFTARSRSTTLSAATTYGFFLLSFVWPGVVTVGAVALESQFGVVITEGTAETAVQLSPVFAYQNVVSALGPGVSAPVGHIPEWGGVVVLLAWAGLGYALAAKRFGGVDL